MSSLFTKYSDILKANPYHDRLGRFTTAAGAGGSSLPKGLKNDPRSRLADRLGLKLNRYLNIAANTGNVWGATAREAARLHIDKTIAEAASKLKFRDLMAWGARDRRALADKILYAMSETQRGRLADRIGVRNDYNVVDHMLRLSNASLHRVFWDHIDIARSKALDRVKGQL